MVIPVITVIQILRALLAQQPDQCQHCGGTDFEIGPLLIDRSYLIRHVLHQGRSPPNNQAEHNYMLNNNFTHKG